MLSPIAFRSNKKHIILTVRLILFIVAAQGQPKKDSTWILSDNGCKVYNPNPIKNESITWSGDCVDGYAHGEGKLTWYKKEKKTDTYTGKMKKGQPHGRGKYEYNSGNIFEGEYVNGELEGYGQVTWKYFTGSIEFLYRGNFKNDLPNGQGEEIWFEYNGDTVSIYNGHFSNWHTKHGYGVLKRYAGKKLTITQGKFIENKLEGEIAMQEFENGKLIREYKGGFQNEKRNGIGKEIYGISRYFGEWKQDKKEGKGKLMMDTVLIYDGDWKNNKFNGAGKRYYFDNGYYFGEFKNNQRNGFGIMIWRDGSKYIGEFSEDLFSGLGYIVKQKSIDNAGVWESGTLMINDKLKIKELNTKYEKAIKKFNTTSN